MLSLTTFSRALAPIALCSLLAAGCQVTIKTEGNAQGPAGDWNSVFDKVGGGITNTTLSLSQSGNTINGRYLDAATLTGQIQDHHAWGTWQNGGKTGNWDFNFDATFNSFQGSWTTPEEAGHSYGWNGTRR